VATVVAFMEVAAVADSTVVVATVADTDNSVRS
jgi:hypothetical protein